MSLRSMIVVCLACLGLVCAYVTAEPATRAARDGHAPDGAGKLFETTKIWDVHFRFTADQWAAMEPKEKGGFFTLVSLMLGGRKGPTAPGELLTLAMLKQADRGRDGKVDREEMLALADRWFTRMDYARGGALGQEELTAGLDAILDPEGVVRGAGFPFSLRGSDGKRNGLATAMGVEFNTVRGALEFEDQSLDSVAVRYKGNGTFFESRDILKRSLKVDLNEFAKGQRLAGQAKLNFHNNVADPSSMSEVLSLRLYRDAGVPASRTAYAKVYVTVPGKHERRYFGLYSIVENVDEAFAKDRFDTKKGAIFKPVTPSLFSDLGDEWADYVQTYDPKTDVSAAQARRVIEFSRLVTYGDDEEFAAKLGDYLDLDQFARYMAVTVYLSTMDSILMVGQNYYLYLHPKTGKFQFIPWDLDHSFGQIFGEQQQLGNLSIRRPWVGRNRFLERVFRVEAFKKQYLARLEEFGGTIFDPKRLGAQVEETPAAIRPAIAEESKNKAGRMDQAISAEPVKKGGFFAPKPVNSLRRFVDWRTPSVLEQLAGKSHGQPATGFGGPPGRPQPGPGDALAPVFMAAMDRDGNGRVNRGEFARAFGAWFDAWDTGKAGAIVEADLRSGVGRDLHAGRAATRPAAKEAPK